MSTTPTDRPEPAHPNRLQTAKTWGRDLLTRIIAHGVVEALKEAFFG
ncbi:hypothetical protein [Rhodococcus sp. USK13]|nr:hypothetical protein [Rhodococcus sp. USK13]